MVRTLFHMRSTLNICLPTHTYAVGVYLEGKKTTLFVVKQHDFFYVVVENVSCDEKQLIDYLNYLLCDTTCLFTHLNT